MSFTKYLVRLVGNLSSIISILVKYAVEFVLSHEPIIIHVMITGHYGVTVIESENGLSKIINNKPQ